MQATDGMDRWAIPLGTWAGVRVRLHVLFPIIAIFYVQWLGAGLGLICFGIFVVLLLLHEFAHVTAARMTGGEAHEILVWPLGGLAFCRPALTLQSQFLTPAAGPLTHVLFCLATLPAVLQAELLREALLPGYLPIGELGHDHLWRDLAILTFSMNWLLLLINLLPAFPLDGGQMVQAVLSDRMGSDLARPLAVRIGFWSGLILGAGGLLFDHATIVALGLCLGMLNLGEIYRLQFEELYGGRGDPGFSSYGYDEDDETPRARAPRLSLWQRWKQSRAVARREREMAERAAAARRLDELLDKVHREGLQSLTAEERRFLDRASQQHRTQQRDH